MSKMNLTVVAQKSLAVATKASQTTFSRLSTWTSSAAGHLNVAKIYTQEYGSLARSLVREVAAREQVSLPRSAQWPVVQKEWTSFITKARSRPFTSWVMHSTPFQIGSALLVALELSGWLWIGEIIGRRHLIGYKH